MNPNHLVVGCPSGFDLADCLKSAESVKLAMAFAKRSGWSLFRESLMSGPKNIEILVGLNFGITDPALLQEWLAIANKPSSQMRIRIAPWYPIFHPKVIIARFAPGSDFAIVGSGNLTGGGQHHNIECGVFLTSSSDIDQVENWYTSLRSTPLTQRIIDQYKPLSDQASKLARNALKSRELVAALNPGAAIWYRDAFLSDFAEFLETPRGQDAVKGRIEGAKRIRGSADAELRIR